MAGNQGNTERGIGRQGAELQAVLGDALGPLLNTVQPSSYIGPVRGVIECPLEVVRELLEIGAKLWVVPHRCHGPVQSPVGE